MNFESVIFTLIAYCLAYYLFYIRNKLIGNVMFTIISVTVMFGSSNETQKAIGLILVGASVVNLIYDLIGKMK